MCRKLHTEKGCGGNLTRGGFRGGRGGRAASGRGESSGAVGPTRKAAPGGARREQKGHTVDPRLAGAGRAARAPPDRRRRRDRPAEPLPPRRPALAPCGSDAGSRSETADCPPRSTAVTASASGLLPDAPRLRSDRERTATRLFAARLQDGIALFSPSLPRTGGVDGGVLCRCQYWRGAPGGVRPASLALHRDELRGEVRP
jgi:hypothetical protein